MDFHFQRQFARKTEAGRKILHNPYNGLHFRPAPAPFGAPGPAQGVSAHAFYRDEAPGLRMPPAMTPVGAGLCVRLLSQWFRGSGRGAGREPGPCMKSSLWTFPGWFRAEPAGQKPAAGRIVCWPGRRAVRFRSGLRRTPRPPGPEGPEGGGFVRGSPVRGTGAAQGVPS